MRKLTKNAYNKIVNSKILNTGLYNGRNVEEAEDCDELYEHLQEIKQDYQPNLLTAFNADAHIAFNYLKFEEVSDDYDIDFDQDDFYGSNTENMHDINDHFGKF
ncbi:MULTISPECIES: hypothetical protein [Acinetobacter]|uniref:hypothetical protein n=1 Tax=Acinetobacter TaxID=469 RepID=UPI0002AEBB02|nr:MULTISPECIES: hypothetical protein [Acinetobacter]ELW77043.1 hypothetical protein ACINWC743_A0622 [Acinetobacter sp. WC-743]MBJ8428133.1 hypothetical protein [Acinetobacter bereziniae]